MPAELATFLFADLAGYTALTEAHGDEVAADVAEDFCAELNRRLPSCAEDIKMLGDSCLVRGEDAACTLGLGLALVEDVGARHGFPDVKVGLHTGTAVQRGRDWFGGGVNTAARVVEMAAPGEVLLTMQTRQAAGDVALVAFEDLGERNAKHLAAPLHVLRARTAGQAPRPGWAFDPVCRMRVEVGKRATSVSFHGQDYSFCSALCAGTFSRSPERYARET